MRISDWSSDVCSSDLSARTPRRRTQGARPGPAPFFAPAMRPARSSPLHELPMSHDPRTDHRLPAARRLPMLALPAALLACASPALAADANPARSDEHTSELQSLMRISYAVFCLKKKKLT